MSKKAPFGQFITPDHPLFRLLIDLVPDLIRTTGEELGGLLRSLLGQLGKTCQVERAFLGTITPAKDMANIICQWQAGLPDEYTPNVRTITKEQLPWIFAQILKTQNVVCPDLAQLPANATTDCRFLTDLGINACIIVPLTDAKHQAAGFLGLAVREAAHSWSAAEIELLPKIAEAISLALQREKRLADLHQSAKLYQLLLDTIKIGVVITQADHLLFVNKALAAMLGYQVKELVGVDYRQVYTEEGVQLLHERQSKRQMGLSVAPTYQTTFRRRDGSIIEVEISSVITEYNDAPATFGIVRDITEELAEARLRQDLEMQLRRYQRSTELSLLASTLVHNLREGLTVIMGRAQLVKNKAYEGKEPDLIIETSRRIQKVFDSFIKKLSLERSLEPVSFNFNELIQTEILFLESDPFFKNQVKKELYLDRGLPDYVGIYTDFAQSIVAFMTVAINNLRPAAEKKMVFATHASQSLIYLSIQTPHQIFSPEEASSLFVAQFTLPKGGSDQRTLERFQLYKAYLTLNRYQVQVNVHSDATGTIFEFLIPLNTPSKPTTKNISRRHR